MMKNSLQNTKGISADEMKTYIFEFLGAGASTHWN